MGRGEPAPGPASLRSRLPPATTLLKHQKGQTSSRRQTGGVNEPYWASSGRASPPSAPPELAGGALLCPGQRKRRMQLSSAFRNHFVLNSRTALWEEGSCWCSYGLSQGIFGKDAPGCSSHQWGDSICPQHFPNTESAQYLPATHMLEGGQGTRQVHHCPAHPE